MAYVKNTWKDRAVATASRYLLSLVSGNTYDITAVPGTVTEAGTQVTAERMNNIEQGIYEAAAPGDVKFTARTTAPDGWLKANGAAVSRATYADLFTAIGTTYGVGDGSTTFNLPDLRGEFLRALDDGRGVDTGRVLGSAQAQSLKTHAHGGTTSENGEFTLSDVVQISTSGGIAMNNTATPSTLVNTENITISSHTHTFTSGNTGDGTENRPRNVALLAVIKY